MSLDPLVSAIVPVHNRPALLREAVESVLAQSWRRFEVIIVDDGSTDDTPAVAARLAREAPGVVRVLSIANAGPGAAREAGRRQARGDYLQYLDSDDLLAPDKFARQVEALRARPDCAAAYGITRAYRIGETPSGAAWKRTGERIEAMFPSMLIERWWGTSTPLYARSFTDRAGPWLSLWNEEDWEYDCRIAALGAPLAFCDAWVSDNRFHDGPCLSFPRDPRPALGDRARARAAIFAQARRAGIAADALEMRHFARATFLLARQCGAAGLPEESRALFDLARRAAGPRARGLDFLAYRAAAFSLGWGLAGRLACRLDAFRA